MSDKNGFIFGKSTFSDMGGGRFKIRENVVDVLNGRPLFQKPVFKEMLEPFSSP